MSSMSTNSYTSSVRQAGSALLGLAAPPTTFKRGLKRFSPDRNKTLKTTDTKKTAKKTANKGKAAVATEHRATRAVRPRKAQMGMLGMRLKCELKQLRVAYLNPKNLATRDRINAIVDVMISYHLSKPSPVVPALRDVVLAVVNGQTTEISYQHQRQNVGAVLATATTKSELDRGLFYLAINASTNPVTDAATLAALTEFFERPAMQRLQFVWNRMQEAYLEVNSA